MTGTWTGTWTKANADRGKQMQTDANRCNERTRSAGKTHAVSPFRVCTLQGPALCGLTERVYFGAPCSPCQLLVNGTVYPSQHFLVASPTCTSLFMQPRSVKVTRTVKLDCQVRLSFRNSWFPFKSPCLWRKRRSGSGLSPAERTVER